MQSAIGFPDADLVIAVVAKGTLIITWRLDIVKILKRGNNFIRSQPYPNSIFWNNLIRNQPLPHCRCRAKAAYRKQEGRWSGQTRNPASRSLDNKSWFSSGFGNLETHFKFSWFYTLASSIFAIDGQMLTNAVCNQPLKSETEADLDSGTHFHNTRSW